MDFDAITLDTSILERLKYNLENSLLSKFGQFSRTPEIEFVISEIVLGEMISHMETKTKEALSAYKKSLKEKDMSFLYQRKIHCLLKRTKKKRMKDVHIYYTY